MSHLICDVDDDGYRNEDSCQIGGVDDDDGETECGCLIGGVHDDDSDCSLNMILNAWICHTNLQWVNNETHKKFINLYYLLLYT